MVDGALGGAKARLGLVEASPEKPPPFLGGLEHVVEQRGLASSEADLICL